MGDAVYLAIYILAGQSCTQGDIRLVNGANQYEGRVEVCNQNVWGTVCGDNYGRRDTSVICRQLGFASAGMQLAIASWEQFTWFAKGGSI